MSFCLSAAEETTPSWALAIMSLVVNGTFSFVSFRARDLVSKQAGLSLSYFQGLFYVSFSQLIYQHIFIELLLPARYHVPAGAQCYHAALLQPY